MRRPAQIEASHARLMQELGALSTGEPGNELAAQARRLLTRNWGRASWRAREDILAAASWLMRLARHRRSADHPLLQEPRA